METQTQKILPGQIGCSQGMFNGAARQSQYPCFGGDFGCELVAYVLVTESQKKGEWTALPKSALEIEVAGLLKGIYYSSGKSKSSKSFDPRDMSWDNGLVDQMLNQNLLQQRTIEKELRFGLGTTQLPVYELTDMAKHYLAQMYPAETKNQ